MRTLGILLSGWTAGRGGRVAAVPRQSAIDGRCLGHACPATLKLLWTYEAGEPSNRRRPLRAERSTWDRNRPICWPSISKPASSRWKYKAKDGIGESSPAVHDGVVYIGDLSGLLHAVSAADGKALWTFKTEAEIKSSPVVAGDRVLIGSYDGNLYCLSARDGKLLWKFTTSNYVHATPVISSGHRLYCRLRRDLSRHSHRGRQGGVPVPLRRIHGASPALLGSRLFTARSTTM